MENNNDDSTLNNNHTVPTLELIDIDDVNTHDFYPKSNTRKDVSYFRKIFQINE